MSHTQSSSHGSIAGGGPSRRSQGQGHPPQMLRANHIHSHNHIHAELDSASISSSHFDIDWEAKEHELEEARARAAQMEKTMRWWSDCTANWREKWSKVRTERNKSREESKILRTKLEMALNDCSAIRREKQSIEHENEFLRAEIERFQQGSPYSHQAPAQDSSIPTFTNTRRLVTPDPNDMESVSQLGSPVKSEQSCSPIPVQSPWVRSSPAPASKDSLNGSDMDETLGAIPKIKSPVSHTSYGAEEHSFPDGRFGKYVDPIDTVDVEYLQQKLTHLKLRLDEATKTIQAEREEKGSLHRSTESLELELLELRSRVEELKCAKQEAERQLLISQDQYRQQVICLQQEQRDEANSRETLDRRLADLRSELERLQTENAAEWGRRERVETERQALERDNKKLRTTLSDLQERLEKRNCSSSSGHACMSGSSHSGAGDLDNKVHEELEEKNKELMELRHAHNKLKKALQDRSVELSHGLRRAEHSEAEVRRLRSRIDELKREVASAQDELDAATNNVRKLQRTNEEIQEQMESLQMQVTHLQGRLRSSNGSFLLHRESLLTDTQSEDDGNEY